MADRQHVVIIGGGFGGLEAARCLAKAPVDVTLIDRRNFHLFQPLLYQVATGGLSPANIAAPLRAILKNQENCRVVLAEATGFDLGGRKVLLSDGEVGYDTLIVATGAVASYFGNEDWVAHAPSLKSVDDATFIRKRILLAFEAAEREADPERRAEWLRFVIIGAGPTGVEMAGAVAELARGTMRDDFRTFDPSQTEVILLDYAERVLPTFTEELSYRAGEHLKELDVQVRLGAEVTDIGARVVRYRRGEKEASITADTIVWAAGVSPTPLAGSLASAAGVECTGGGQLPIRPDCSLEGHPEVYVIGDMAYMEDESGDALPGMAPVAVQQAKFVAGRVEAKARGIRPGGKFRYKDLGTMAVIGRSRAVARVFGMDIWGYPAWLIWLFIHLMKLVGFANRVLVWLQWGWNYLTWNRYARLITGRNTLPLDLGDREEEE
ncbi:MAG: NAD(P)-binding protein [Armatimonadia bacterium]|nr:NAD(P)-binding protein [Armatimonadia bacterium]